MGVVVCEVKKNKNEYLYICLFSCFSKKVCGPSVSLVRCYIIGLAIVSRLKRVISLRPKDKIPM